jgi:hypothetical protein
VGADLARAVLVSEDPVASALEHWPPLISAAAAIARRRADEETTAAVNDTLEDLAAHDDWAALIPVLPPDHRGSHHCRAHRPRSHRHRHRQRAPTKATSEQK